VVKASHDAHEVFTDASPLLRYREQHLQKIIEQCKICDTMSVFSLLDIHIVPETERLEALPVSQNVFE